MCCMNSCLHSSSRLSFGFRVDSLRVAIFLSSRHLCHRFTSYNKYQSPQHDYKERKKEAELLVKNISSFEMSTAQERAELDAKARQGETVVPGGTGGKSLEAQENLAKGRSHGGQTRREQLGKEGYQEMGRKGGLSTMDESGRVRAEREGIEIDETKYRTKS